MNEATIPGGTVGGESPVDAAVSGLVPGESFFDTSTRAVAPMPNEINRIKLIISHRTQRVRV